MNETPELWVPIREITDWRIGGPADRPYDNPEQARADLLSLMGVEATTVSSDALPEPGAADPDKARPNDQAL